MSEVYIHMSNTEFLGTLKNMYSEKSTILYHGSSTVVKFPVVRVAECIEDFSLGFYCTNNYEQAERWARRKHPEHIINVYSYKEDPTLNILKFDDMTEEWLDFIVMCRSGEAHDYDIVEGPMVDDTIWNAVGDFIDGNISRTAFWKLVRFKYPIHQISFHALRAINCLKFEGSEKV